jgi:hypothetical protein
MQIWNSFLKTGTMKRACEKNDISSICIGDGAQFVKNKKKL